MNDTAIKNFAVAARRQLLDDVRLQMKRWAIDEDGGVPATADTLQGEILTPQQRRQRAELLALCKAKGEDQLAEQAAYTWFNRFLAIRFMELHDYLPCGLRFFSSSDGSFDPQVLKEALQADIEGVDRARVAELVRSSDDEALFRYLFIAQCNELASCMPAVFERVGSAMELLLPESLLREGSVLDHMVSDIPEDDWREGVEIVGWMYQYYVSERKDEVFASFKKGKKAEKDAIAPATQLFTPNWIVRYLVENSLGRLWMLNHPDSGLKDRMKYFIAPDAEAHEEFKCVSSPEEITVCDPACGSGHILVYAFELLAAMYEESGYMRRDIPRAILENNLSGMEIDPRAGALASFALTMKALEVDSRFLRREVQPDIKVLKPVSLVEEELELVPEIADRKALVDAVEHMDECGSLYEPDEEDLAALKIAADRLASGVSDLFADFATEKIRTMLADCEALARKFDVVVANPPYMGSKNMNSWLSGWIKKNYPDVKSDLFSAFIVRNTYYGYQFAELGFMAPYVWMFIGSYEKLRSYLIDQKTITSLIQLEYSGFAGATVPICTFTLHNSCVTEYRGGYVRLSDFVGADKQAPKALEAIQNPNCGWFYRRKAQDFKSIPGIPIAYWVCNALLRAFSRGYTIERISDYTGSQNKTGDNERFLRFVWEVACRAIGVEQKWVLYAKGGDYRRWYGNLNYVIDWSDEARCYYSSNPTSNLLNSKYWFREGVTYTMLTSGKASFRYLPPECVFDMSGPEICGLESNLANILGFLNSSFAQDVISLLNPTLNLQAKDLKALPLFREILSDNSISNLVNENVALAFEDWNSQETSIHFARSIII